MGINEIEILLIKCYLVIVVSFLAILAQVLLGNHSVNVRLTKK